MADPLCRECGSHHALWNGVVWRCVRCKAPIPVEPGIQSAPKPKAAAGAKP